jgi:hypothetical protein
VYTFPDGGGEATAYYHVEQDQVRNDGGHRGDEPPLESNRERAGRRAKAEVLRRTRTAGHCYLGTLTMPDAWAEARDYDAAAELVGEFFHRTLGPKIGAGGYVVVGELTKRGCWHWHFTCRTRLQSWWLMTAWTAHCGRRGLTPARSLFVRTNLVYRPPATAARYLAKYITKTFTEAAVPPGRHRYRVGARTETPDPARIITVGSRQDFTEVYGVIEDAAAGADLGWWVHPEWGSITIRWSGSDRPPPR